MKGLPRALRAHFLAPRHVGDPAGAAGRGRAENPACGDVLELGLALGPDGSARVCFRAGACSAVIAVASLVAEHLDGKPVAELERLDVARLVAEAGGLPARKRHAVALVERALAQARDGLRARYP